MNTSESTSKIYPAFAKAQGTMTNVARKSKGHNYKYADLAAVMDTVRGPLADNGLAVIQAPVNTDSQMIGVQTRIIHTSGEWIESELFIPVVAWNPQGVGSAITYAKRYSLMSLMGLPSEDDDAQSAMPKNKGDAVSVPKNTPAATNVPAEIPDGSGHITAAQAADLRKLMSDCEVAEKDFCERINRERLEQLPANKYEGALGFIEQMGMEPAEEETA